MNQGGRRPLVHQTPPKSFRALHTRPEGVDQVGDHISPRGAKVHGVGEAHAKHPEK